VSGFDLVEGCQRDAVSRPPIYVLVTLAIVFFCFFYNGAGIQPKETADNLKKSGAFLPGIRPGIRLQACREDHARLTMVARCTLRWSVCCPDFGGEVECAVLLWRHLVVDSGSGDHGFHGASSVLPDDASVRELAEEGNFKGGLAR